MSPHFNEEDESPSTAQDISGRTPRFLPGKASIKDDLQQVYEMEKEIGSAVFRLHRLLHQVQVTTSTSVKSHELEEALESITATLTQQQTVLQGTLSELSKAAEEQSEHNTRVEEDWTRIQTAASVILKDHGYDPRTLAEPAEEVKRLGRWLNHLQTIFVGIIVTLLSTWILSSYSKALLADQKAANEGLIKETKELADVVKRQQQELNDHITKTRPR